MKKEFKYCPCKGCSVAREEGREEIREIVEQIHRPYKETSTVSTCTICHVTYPCSIVKKVRNQE